MFTTLQSTLKRASRWLPMLLLPLAAQAQNLNYAASNASNVTGTYTDLGTTGAAITTANTDDANSAAQPIGFTFSFNGATFTDFVLNTNGFLRLGTAAPSAAALFISITAAANTDPFQSTNAADVNLVAPFNVDLTAGNGAGGAEYRVTTTGTTPNRVCTIQWKNVSDKAGTTAVQFANFSFQAKLFETTNAVDFVYDAPTASAAAPAFRFSQVGLKGSGFAAGQFLQALKQSAALWSAATFANSITGTTLNTVNYRNNVNPVAGTTYRFVPTVLLNNDVAVTALYTLGKVSSTYGSPVTAQAVVTNAGATAQTNLVVSLTVNGGTALTQTVATLAAGASATVTFTYPATGTTGTNNLAVTVPADDLATNNTKTATQTITATELSHFPAGTTTYTGGLGSNTVANTMLLVRYQVTSPGSIATVTPTFVGTGTATNTYQVVIYSATGTGNTPGTLLYTSPTRTRPATAGVDPVPVPNINVTGDFFVGVKQLTTANISLAFLTDAPLRPATFYISANGTTFNDLGASTLAPRMALDVTLAPTATCSVVTGLAAGSITTTGATVTFTAPTGATGYTVTYTAAGGMPVTVTPAPTASPVVLTGLTPNTAYTVSVTTNCGAGATSGVVTTTFTTTPPVPANDNCTAATALPVGTTCTNTLGTTTGATASTAPVPAPSCGGAAVGPLLDVWYSLVVPASGALTVSTSAVTSSPPNDTVLELYSGACGTLTSVGCNDDFGGTDYSTVSVSGLTAGATLYARVRSFGNSPTGAFNICATAVTCLPVTGLTAGSITTTGATVTFTAPAGATGYTVTYTAAGGMPVTVTPAPTASPVVLTGLAPSTAYTVSVTTNCGAGQTSSTATTTFTTRSTPAPYATLPVNESFEGTWINGSGTRDLPGINWRNTPATGNNSWRRDDDGTSAGWLFATSNGYTPASSQGARSARFHSAWAVSGLTGSLDLYVNLSGAAGTRTLTFDYINPTSSTTNPADKLDVLVSTDGGTTFGATPLLAATNSATFTGRTVVIPSTSATTVIRFRALADFGNDDLGIDNVQLRVVSSTRNEALAAAVGLYPNPTHQRFTLAVPAGSLHKASATLLNALGQVVQQRQLNLPAAGGTTDFDVSNLAPGVYSLQLKTGDELVVKRVVVE